MKQNKMCDFRFFTFRKFVSQIMCDFDIAFFSNVFCVRKGFFYARKTYSRCFLAAFFIKNAHNLLENFRK